MTTKRWKRIAALVPVLSMLTALTGCWDNREIDQLFILTGSAVDLSDNPEQIDVTLQVANITSRQSGLRESNAGSEDAVLLLKAVSNSILGGITEINRDSDHKVLFQHNQIRIIGIAVAEQGVKKYLDMLLRDPQARLELPLAIVDGRGEDALAAKLSQEPISGIFIGGMFRDLSKVSVKYQVRLIDLIHRLLDGTAAPVMPIIKVTGEGDKQEIKMAGMAIFHDDKMIGRLSNDETLGYIWSFGDVKKCNFEITDNSSRATLHINTLDCKRELTLRPDGGVEVALSINSVIGIGELHGFEELKPSELLKYLENLAQEEIKKKITDCFKTAQHLNADIFGYCTTVYQKYPKQWNEMKDRWDEIFSDIDLSVQVKVTIPGTGQIVQSLEMEETLK
jgi:spore germination protein KC